MVTPAGSSSAAVYTTFSCSSSAGEPAKRLGEAINREAPSLALPRRRERGPEESDRRPRERDRGKSDPLSRLRERVRERAGLARSNVRDRSGEGRHCEKQRAREGRETQPCERATHA